MGWRSEGIWHQARIKDMQWRLESVHRLRRSSWSQKANRSRAEGVVMIEQGMGGTVGGWEHPTEVEKEEARSEPADGA